MLSKFFPALNPKEYSVQVLKDSTSQSAVKRIKRTRTATPLKKIVSLMLALAFIVGGLASATIATAVTAKQAQANIFSDQVCISGDADNAGKWNSGGNRFATIGGRSQFASANVTKSSVPNDAADGGIQVKWPAFPEYRTAYEKYGILYPIYDAWVPVYTEKESLVVKRVDIRGGSYSSNDNSSVRTSDGGTTVQAGTTPLVTSDIGACMALMQTMSASISNMISLMPRFVMAASIQIYGSVYGTSISDRGSILYDLGKSIDKFITQPGGLKDSLFIPFLGPIILIGAIWVGYMGIVKRAMSSALQSTGWMILAIALGFVFLAQPTLVSAKSDQIVSTVQTIINDSVLSTSNTDSMCDLPSHASRDYVKRETQCTIWLSTIYSTWVAGQFGEGANSVHGEGSVLTQGAGRTVLKTTEYQIYYGKNNIQLAQTWPQFMVDRQATSKSYELSEVAWAQLSGRGGARINNDWAGNIGMISSAILMFFGAGASSAVLLVYCFALLTYQLMMVSAVLFSPFFFLFGIIPNWGRRVLMRYAELLTSLMIKRIITSFMLAFYLIFYNLVVGDAQTTLLILKMILVFALAIFFIGARSKFVKLFADKINFGGEKSIGLPGNKAVAVTAGVTAGLVGGGLLGAVIMGKKVRKQNSDIEGKIEDIQLNGASNPTADVKNQPLGKNAEPKSKSNPLKTAASVVGTVDAASRVKSLIPTGGSGAAAAGTASTGAAAAGTASTGAAAAGTGAAAAGAGTGAAAAAAGTATAAGAAAGAGTVAAGAAAGSVVPVVGTAVGAAAGLAAMAAQQKRAAKRRADSGE